MNKLKIKACNYTEPQFKVEYTLNIPDTLKNIVNRSYWNFIAEIMEELESVKKQKVGEYIGNVSKNLKSGIG
jgi:hypothetical protein